MTEDTQKISDVVKIYFVFLTVVFMGSSAVKEWEILVLFLFYFLRWRRWGL